MSQSTKYGRTYHYTFSPGTTSDDRFNHDWEADALRIPLLIHTEKLDGENNCLSRYGVFARSHVAPTVSPWTEFLRQKWQRIKRDLGDLEVFGENMYAIHSIEYKKLESHFYVFAIRLHDHWLSWEETCFYAALLDFPTVPLLACTSAPQDAEQIKKSVTALSSLPSDLDSRDMQTGLPCTREGIVSRNAAGYATADFLHNVFKYVRKGHVKTDEHWTRNWKRAPLLSERRTK